MPWGCSGRLGSMRNRNAYSWNTRRCDASSPQHGLCCITQRSTFSSQERSDATNFSAKNAFGQVFDPTYFAVNILSRSATMSTVSLYRQFLRAAKSFTVRQLGCLECGSPCTAFSLRFRFVRPVCLICNRTTTSSHTLLGEFGSNLGITRRLLDPS